MDQPKFCDSCKERLRPHSGLTMVSTAAWPRVLLCIRCYLKMMNDETLSDSDWPDFKPIITHDCEGVERHFEFWLRPLRERILLEAREIRDDQSAGYQFSVAGDLEADPMALFQTLYERLRRELGRKYLTESGRGPEIGDRHTMRGAIEWDSEKDVDVPRLVIDGQAVSWEEMGRMLVSYEGWAFKLEIFDFSDEDP